MLCAKADSLFDCYALGRCVATSGHKWSIDFSYVGGDETVKMLGCGLWSVGEIHGTIHKLCLVLNALTHQGMTYLNEFPHEILRNISILDLSENDLNKSAFDILANTLQYMINLIGLRIYHIDHDLFSDCWMVKLFRKLIGTKIYKLDISSTHLGLRDIHALSSLIRTQLKELIIGEWVMSSDSVELMVEKILTSTSLKHVHIEYVKYTEESASMFNLLESNKRLISLQFKNCLELNLVVPHVAKALHTNKKKTKIAGNAILLWNRKSNTWV